MGAITHYIVKGTEKDGGEDVFLIQRDPFWGTTTSRASAHEFLSEAEARAVRTELLGDGVVLRVHPDGTEEAVYGCVLGACHLHREGQGCQLGHDPPTACPWQRGQAPSPGARANRKEGLSMFCVFSPFQEIVGTVLDMVGPWPTYFFEKREDARAPVAPPTWTGCAVWEGAAEREPDEQVGGWTLEGRWRKPNYVEMRKLADGRFPLRRKALPENSELVPFGTKEGPC